MIAHRRLPAVAICALAAFAVIGAAGPARAVEPAGTELFPNGTDMGTNSHAMQMLAELMGMPGPELSRDCLSLLRPDLAPAEVDAFTSSAVT